MPSPTVFNEATSQWVHAAAIADPSGGTTPDAEGRTAVVSILAVLRGAGVIAGATDLNVSQTWNGPTNQVAQHPAIADPSGGASPDAAARTAIGSVLTVLRSTGLIAGGTTGPAFVLDGAQHQWADGADITDLAVDGSADDQLRTALNSALAAMRLAELIA
ncbi:hypothetical protein [Streptomyces beihaiensis]|uniref:Uncharacterized protein n=1 Tax=Streptomyces beihaiensis TaxID=2984495 RepID=A0ABT3U4F2_9ACTN|nr:hypothetical protein [Streptomyces beihaiensis]MCX3064209.1 hypothetical protein [Streptomyces beihaiensis]